MLQMTCVLLEFPCVVTSPTLPYRFYSDGAFMITGSLVALVTPMHPDGEIHWEDLDKLVDFHIENGTYGNVAVVSTGQFVILGTHEHIAGIGQSVTRHGAETV